MFDNSASLLYDGVSAMYTLRRPSMSTLWTNAVVKIRRTSDNQTAFLFIDGSSIDDTISLSSLISTSSNTTPSATTLSTWVGSSNAFIEEWLGITPNNTIDNNKTAIQTTTTSQPQLISSGVIITKNGKPSIDFLSDTRYLDAEPNTDLEAGKSFTILSVSYNDVNNSFGIIISNILTSSPNADRIVLFNDRRTQKRILNVSSSGTDAFANGLTQENHGNQKLLTGIVDGSGLTATSYYNKTIQSSEVVWNGTYRNTAFRIGVQQNNSSPLLGGVQEIPIFPSDKTIELTALHTDIDTYYSIP